MLDAEGQSRQCFPEATDSRNEDAAPCTTNSATYSGSRDFETPATPAGAAPLPTSREHRRKRRPNKRPRHAVVVTTYAEFDHWNRSYAQGEFNLLILVGPPGVQKTQRIREALGAREFLWLGGHVTPLQMYMEMLRHRNQLVCIDDVDNLYGNRGCVGLLKCACQTEKVKTIAWHSSKLEQEEVPTEFTTASKFCIIANDWRTFNETIGALGDRGQVVFFEPTTKEVHCRTADWFTDQEIYEFIGAYLHLIPQHSMRSYVRALELKRAAMDWRRILRRQWLSGYGWVVAELLEDSSFASEEARVQEFERLTGKTRATYFRHKKKLANNRPDGLTQ